MDADDFIKSIRDKSEKDYGMCPPPISAEEGLEILIKHFLGDDWYTTMSLSREQVYTEAIYNILKKNPQIDPSKFKFQNLFDLTGKYLQ